ncbi:MAG: hypothetical protein Q7R73_02035 [bacterium]|nr:hypothetical protein [bacterium]
MAPYLQWAIGAKYADDLTNEVAVPNTANKERQEMMLWAMLYFWLKTRKNGVTFGDVCDIAFTHPAQMKPERVSELSAKLRNV